MKVAPRKLLVCLFVFCAVCCVVFAGNGPSSRFSDAGLRSLFFKHRHSFEKLAAMAQEDNHLVRIAPDFTWLDNDYAWPRKNIGISEQRWNEYRVLFRRTHVSDGILKDINPPRIYFPVETYGLVPTGFEKGFAYSQASLHPLLRTLDKKPPDKLWHGSHLLVYESLDGHWYLFYQQW